LSHYLHPVPAMPAAPHDYEAGFHHLQYAMKNGQFNGPDRAELARHGWPAALSLSTVGRESEAYPASPIRSPLAESDGSGCLDSFRGGTS
jgi:hypothetical protein